VPGPGGEYRAIYRDPNKNNALTHSSLSSTGK
jgi:hypothetical protein